MEITKYRFHDILFKFFMALCLFGIFMLFLDLFAVSNKMPIFMFGQPLHGYDILYGIIPEILLIIGCAWLADKHKKSAIQSKWRNT